MPAAVGGTQGTTTTNPFANQDKDKATKDPQADQMGKDMFLKLLVAQLKYQNPLQPADPQNFLAQTAMFTMVERLDELKKQGESTAVQNRLSTASAMVGRDVTFLRSDGSKGEGTVTGSRIDPDDGVFLKVGKEEVPIEFVQEVREPGSTGAPADTTTSGAGR